MDFFYILNTQGEIGAFFYESMGEEVGAAVNLPLPQSHLSPLFIQTMEEARETLTR